MKKLIAGVVATALVASFASVGAFAATTGKVSAPGGTWFLDDDGETPSMTDSGIYDFTDGSINIDGVNPNQTLYLYLGANGTTATTLVDDNAEGGTTEAYPDDLADSDLFKMSVDKDGDGKSLVKSVTQVADKSLGGNTRGGYIKIVLGDTTSTSEEKATLDITFTAKKDSVDSDGDNLANSASGVWEDDDYADLRITLWISNTGVSGSDGSVDTGASVYFEPEDNEENTLTWGDDRAAIYFQSDDDASNFYARLSTKSNSEIYAMYGDPVGADLWFYDFVGNPTIPSTSRATLTLGIPWDDDDDYTPDPENVYIYQLNADGELEDVTSSFTYDEDNELTGITGWSIKTRTLGTYIVSDMELDIYSYVDEEEEYEDEDVDVTTPESPDKEIPSTGSSDIVSVAMAAGIISLAAAGVVAFKKTK